MRMRATFTASMAMAATCAVLGTTAGIAHAEDWQWLRGDYDNTARLRRHHGGIAGEDATYAGDRGGTQTLLQSPLIGFWYAVANHFTLSVDWGMAYYRENTGGNTDRTFRFGDPMLAGYYEGRIHAIKLYAGMAMAFPAATLPDSNPDFASRAYRAAADVRGDWNIFLWLPEAFSLVFPARIESAGSKHLLLAADAALGIPIFLHGQGSALVLQTAGEVGYKGKHGAVGGRLQFVWWAMNDRPFIPGDYGQLSLEPFFRVDFGKPFITGRLTMNLDHPAGFSFDDGGWWGLHLGVGTEF